MSDPKEVKKTIVLPENVPVDFTFEKMLKSFIQGVRKSGVLEEVKRRRYYTKPSELKRLAAKSKRKK